MLRLCALQICMQACMLPICRYPRRPEEGTRFPDIKTMEDCDLSCGYWKLNPGTLQKEQMLLGTAKPSLRPPK